MVALSALVLGIGFSVGLFSSKKSKALPSNAVEFSQTCFSISDGNAGLFEFNKITGGPSSIGNTGIGSPEASTLNLFGDTLFVIDGNAQEIGFVNLNNGTYTLISNSILNTALNGSDGTVFFEDVDAMTVDNNDHFWVASRDNGDVNPSYLAKMRHNGTFIKNAFGAGVDYIKFDGPDGFPSVIDAMGYDPIEEILYVCANDGSGNPTYNNLMQVNTNNGVGTLVGNFNIGDVEGMGFDGEGNMFVTTGTSSNTTSNRNSFFSVNKTTATATKVFTFSSGTDFETCDCVIGYKNTIKGTVFYDADENTFLGEGESGYGGVVVSLYYDENNNGVYDSGVDGFVRSTTTNSKGEYTLFDAYEYGTLNYVITINTGNLPSGASLTTDNVETASFSSGGNVDLNNDFGYKLSSSPNTISGYVYFDADQDQNFDGGEAAVEGVTVYLYKDMNGNGTYDAEIDEIVDQNITRVNGSYTFRRPFIGGSKYLLSQVDNSNRDADQNGSTTNITNGELSIGSETVGVSFRNIDIPQGATIESAKLIFTSSSIGTNVTSVSIYGQDANSAGRFQTSNNNITDRTQTTATISWIIPYWNTVGLEYETPDITAIVQEIVDRGGWSQGHMAFILPSNSGTRSAVAYDNNPSNAPKLEVTYNHSSLNDNYLTFIDLSTIPAASSLTTDNIENAQFSSGGNTDPNNNFGIYQDLAQVNTISGTVFRDQNVDGSYNGSDLPTNNILVCLFKDANGNQQYDASLDALLATQRTDNNGNYSFQRAYESMGITIESTVSSSADDAEGTTSAYLTSSDLDLAQEQIALRFSSINIPQGATITSAYIQLTAESAKEGAYSVTIDGIDANNVSSFTAGQNLNNLTRTTAQATMSGSESWAAGASYNSPSLVNIVQEIVNRSGWTANNAMGFIINTGTGDKDAYSYDTDPTKAPKLLITYSSNQANYIVITKEDDYPNGYAFTTDNIETAQFTSGGNTDAENNFGYTINTAGLNTITGTVFKDDNNNATLNDGENGISSIGIDLYLDADCDGVVDAGEIKLESTTSSGSGTYSFYPSYSESISVSVGQSGGDAEGTTSANIDDIDLDFAQEQVAIQFSNVNIPQGATITSAYIEFTAEGSKSGTYSFTVNGIDQNNTQAFTAGQSLNGLSKTSASAIMSGSTDWTIDQKYNSPSLVSIVQEIVNRGGWIANNGMGFIFSLGTGDRDAYSFDNASSKAPKLVVEYEPAQICYIVQIDQTDVASHGTLTTTNHYTISFSSSGQTDGSNDFGIYYAPLPVELIYFNGNWNGELAELSWATSMELNNDYFEVQWSINGLNYQTLETVKGHGTTDLRQLYSFTHLNPENKNFYRLKQVDFNGDFEYSAIVALNRDVSESISFKAYPNPFAESLNISVQTPKEQVGILLVLNANGQEILRKDVNLFAGSQTFPINELS
ncbi:MAG: hypothetical protein KDC92_11035, partial [Bacteroidetes bacterium]|nr:hypothetical protein [Bacteroidota bacterium]